MLQPKDCVPASPPPPPPPTPCVGGPGKLFTNRTGKSELLSWATEAVQHTKKLLIKGELNQTHKLAWKHRKCMNILRLH